MKPEEILNSPLLNRGTGFTAKERETLGLTGFLPYAVLTLEQQVERYYDHFCMQKDDVSKHLFLSSLQNKNETLFYRLLQTHTTEMLPLIYTPTVGDVSAYFSKLHREHRGLYFSYPHKKKAASIIDAIPNPELDVIVVTDGERILGLGDLGVGGIAIPIGKLALYTLFGGIDPARVLPVILDVGTNNATLLSDPMYVGWRHERVTGKDYDDFIALFVEQIKRRYPRVLLQWEDFSKSHARPLLNRYREEICSFNDDIQGTAAVVLSTILTAGQLCKRSLCDERIVVVGAGNAGIGICHHVFEAMCAEGTDPDRARNCFYLIDSEGLIHDGLKTIDDSQRPFARSHSKLAHWNNLSLLETVREVKPTVLIGVCAQPNLFSEEIIKLMAEHTAHPLILPLSNPTEKSEAKPSDLIRWTQGKALIATGSPFPPFEYQGKLYPISQCNNVYIYPGVGLGVVATQASKVTDKMFLEAAKALSLASLKENGGALFPSFEGLRAVSAEIALAVAKVAQTDKLARAATKKSLEAHISELMWTPDYTSALRAKS